MPVSQESKVINFLNTFNSDIMISQLKETDKSPDSRFADRLSQLYIVDGSVTFTNDADAERTFSNLVDLARIDSKQILYSTITIMENTHHYPNPQPDIVLNADIKGDIANIESLISQH